MKGGAVKVIYGKNKHDHMIFTNRDMNKHQVLALIKKIEVIFGFEESSNAWKEQREKIPRTLRLNTTDEKTR